MLDQNSPARQSTIPLFFSLGQGVILRFFERCLAIFMKFRQTLVTSICQYSNMLSKVTVIFLEKLKIVLAAVCEGCGNNLRRLFVRYHLRFLCMPSFFAAIVLFLAFFGRSIGCSLASTSTTSKMVSLGWSAFLPGKVNFPEQIRTSSTF